ncbi:MAG: hypothetical protein EOP34_00945 [Rickettsiales bacterium]|nr:MAG: hypothetical protein EOP34_00945 [Rickettsiales bacterium]
MSGRSSRPTMTEQSFGGGGKAINRAIYSDTGNGFRNSFLIIMLVHLFISPLLLTTRSEWSEENLVLAFNYKQKVM